MLGFAAAGLVAHTAFLYYQMVDAHGLPLSNQRDWYFIAAWVLVVLYLYLTYFHPRVPFGVFVLPLVLGLTGRPTAKVACPLPAASCVVWMMDTALPH